MPHQVCQVKTWSDSYSKLRREIPRRSYTQCHCSRPPPAESQEIDGHATSKRETVPPHTERVKTRFGPLCARWVPGYARRAWALRRAAAARRAAAICVSPTLSPRVRLTAEVTVDRHSSCSGDSAWSRSCRARSYKPVQLRRRWRSNSCILVSSDLSCPAHLRFP